MLLADKRLVFFGGKGGVGKTTMANATALALAKRGAKVLVVSTDPAHNLGHLWDTKIGDEVTFLYDDRLAGLEIDPEKTSRDHFAEVAHTVRRMMPEHLHGEVERYFRNAIDSPGAHEAALLERIAHLSLENAGDWDVVVFDTAPTGHTIRLLEMPQFLTTWAEGMMGRAKKTAQFHDALQALPGSAEEPDTGPVAQRNVKIRQILERRGRLFSQFHKMLTSKSQTGFVIVTLAERLPVAETLALREQLQEAKIPISGVIVNRRSPAGSAGMLSQRRKLEDGHLAKLQQDLKKIPTIEIELQGGELTGVDAIEALADELAEHYK